jgi:DNA-binding LacI/PurR family transcriptional regulator
VTDPSTTEVDQVPHGILSRAVAIFCANDAMAFQVHFVIRQRGLRMPDDVALVGSTTYRRPCRSIRA